MAPFNKPSEQILDTRGDGKFCACTPYLGLTVFLGEDLLAMETLQVLPYLLEGGKDMLLFGLLYTRRDSLSHDGYDLPQKAQGLL